MKQETNVSGTDFQQETGAKNCHRRASKEDLRGNTERTVRESREASSDGGSVEPLPESSRPRRDGPGGE